MKIGNVKLLNSNKNVDVLLFKYSEMKDTILFDTLNFTENIEIPTYVKEMLKYAIKSRFTQKFEKK